MPPTYIKNYVTKTTHGYLVEHGKSKISKAFAVPIFDKIPKHLLNDAKKFLEETLETYEKTKVTSKYECDMFIQKRKDGLGKDLPHFIYYYKNNKNSKKANRHGYKAIQAITKKTKCITTNINNPLTNKMLETVKQYLIQLDIEYESKKILPKYIYYYTTIKNNVRFHGYKIKHSDSNKYKTFTVPISNPLTKELLKEVEEYLQEMVYDYIFDDSK